MHSASENVQIGKIWKKYLAKASYHGRVFSCKYLLDLECSFLNSCIGSFFRPRFPWEGHRIKAMRQNCKFWLCVFRCGLSKRNERNIYSTHFFFLNSKQRSSFATVIIPQTIPWLMQIFQKLLNCLFYNFNLTQAMHSVDALAWVQNVSFLHGV